MVWVKAHLCSTLDMYTVHTLCSFHPYLCRFSKSLLIRTKQSSTTGKSWGSVANSSSETRPRDTTKKMAEHLEERLGELVINSYLYLYDVSLGTGTQLQLLQTSWEDTGQELNVSWTVAKEKWRSVRY